MNRPVSLGLVQCRMHPLNSAHKPTLPPTPPLSARSPKPPISPLLLPSSESPPLPAPNKTGSTCSNLSGKSTPPPPPSGDTPNPGEPFGLDPTQFSSVVWDILATTTQHFGLSSPLRPPEVPFPEPPAHRWVRVMLPNPSGSGDLVATPVLFPMGLTSQGLSDRDKVCLAKMFRFWWHCTRVNERAWKKRVEGLPPPRAWSEIMEEVGHDEDNRNYLWATDNMWEIRFNEMCWVKFGDDTNQVKWFEKYVA